MAVVFRLQDAKEADAEIYDFLAGQKAASLTILSTALLTETHSAVLKALQVCLHVNSAPFFPHYKAYKGIEAYG